MRLGGTLCSIADMASWAVGDDPSLATRTSIVRGDREVRIAHEGAAETFALPCTTAITGTGVARMSA